MKMRNIYKLIEAIKKEIPEDYRNRTSFIAELDNVIDSANYRAPEAYLVNFEQLSNVLQDCLGTPNEEWKGNIANLFNDVTKIEGMDYIES